MRIIQRTVKINKITPQSKFFYNILRSESAPCSAIFFQTFNKPFKRQPNARSHSIHNIWLIIRTC